MTKDQFATERTRIVYEMFDLLDYHPADGNKKYHATRKCFADLDDLFDEITGEKQLSPLQEARNGLV